MRCFKYHSATRDIPMINHQSNRPRPARLNAQQSDEAAKLINQMQVWGAEELMIWLPCIRPVR